MGGATLITYIVFRVVVPTSARDLITVRLKDVLQAVSTLIKHNIFTPQEYCPQRCEATRLRHQAVRAGGGFDQLIDDLYWESNPPVKVMEMRQSVIQLVNANLALAAANSVLTSVPLNYPDPRVTEAMNASVQHLGHVQDQMAEFADGASSVHEIHDLMKQSDRCLLEERNLILELEIADHVDFDKHEHVVKSPRALGVCSSRLDAPHPEGPAEGSSGPQHDAHAHRSRSRRSKRPDLSRSFQNVS